MKATINNAALPAMVNWRLTARNLLDEAYLLVFVSNESKIMRPNPKQYENLVSDERLAGLSQDITGESFGQTAPSPQPPILTRNVVSGLVRFAEMSAILLTGIATWGYLVSDISINPAITYAPIIAYVSIMVPLVAGIAGLYTMAAFVQPIRHIPRLALVWTGVFSTVLALMFFTKAGDQFSRLWLGSYALGGFLLLAAMRTGLARLVDVWNKSGRLDRRAALVGGGKPAGDLIDALRETPHAGVTVTGIFDDRGDDRSPAVVRGCKKLGNTRDLVEYARRNPLDMLIINFPVAAETRLLEVLKQLWVLPVDIRLNTYAQKLRYRPRAYSHIGNLSFLDVFDRPLSGWSLLIKNIEDRLLAGLCLILLSPVMALVALAVRLDSPGPVLFRQKRYGFNNELINVYKFRSMYTDMSDARAEKLATRNDPRITRVGRFIRKTSLDELPQLFNVLKGDLSLVGPRPHPAAAKARDTLYMDVFDGYFARHKGKPGITGWAQINGWRGETDTHDKLTRRVEHDLYYIENWSLLFDLYILARTPFALLNTENAY
ncbi:MAG TPA: undecaprenyl-phosphate glucose phosphotransferase [Rhizobiales bacterium]|nr:undecaprenyl-phosphate glucose phosphotransferase [Hyphomicrobiales bacterium]